MSRGSAGAGGRTLVRLLRAMARPAACVELCDDAEGMPTGVLVLTGAGPTPDVLHRAHKDVWDKAVALGFVAAAPVCGGWQITATGRAAIAHHRSSGAGSTAVDPTPVGGAGERHDRSQARQSIGVPKENLAESPLAWLARRKDQSGASMISEQQFLAGERLRFEYEQAQLMPRMTIDWQRAAQGGSRRQYGPAGELDITERAEAARQRVNRALFVVGPELASVLVDVCCHLKGLEQLEKESGWPQRSGKIILRVALSALSRHYGIGQGDDGASAGPARVRQWGVEGYRPTITEDGTDSGRTPA